MKHLWSLCLVFLVLTLTACAGFRTVPGPSEGWDQRRENLLDLAAWQMNGRIGVKYDSGGGQGNFSWSQQGEESRIRLSGPFGTGAYQILWAADAVTVTDKDGEQQLVYSGPDAAEQFLQQQLGWSFPAKSTRYWLLGLLDPQYEGREVYDDEGRLVGLEQNGWTVSYQHFDQEGAYLLPAKLAIENSRARIRLAIHRWNL